MALNTFRDDSGLTPTEQYFRRFNDAMRDFGSPFAMLPYWFDRTNVEHCNIGNATREILDDKDKFGVEINVAQFTPEELSVNLNERNLVIEGHHKERSDEHGSIERHFIRKYHLPNDASLDQITSNLSKEGVLAINAPKKPASGGRNIPIAQDTPKPATAGGKK